MVGLIWTFQQIELLYLQMRDVVQNRPCFDVFAFLIDIMIIYRMEHEWQWFQKHQHTHDVMDAKNSVSVDIIRCG